MGRRKEDLIQTTSFTVSLSPFTASTGCAIPMQGRFLNCVLTFSASAAHVGLPMVLRVDVTGPNAVHQLAFDDFRLQAGPSGANIASFAPLSGVGAEANFTGVFTHSGGADKQYLAYILFLPRPNVVQFTASGSCLIEYNRISNGMRLIDDAGTGWLGPDSGVAIGPGAPALENSRCRVNVSASTATLSNMAMTVTVNVTFKSAMSAAMGTFLQAFDVDGNFTDMRQFGTWGLQRGSAGPPGPSVLADELGLTLYGRGSDGRFGFFTYHSEDLTAISAIHMLLSDQIFGGKPCHVVYFPISKLANLVDDSGTALVSPGGVLAGTSATLSNSRCSLNVADIGAAIIYSPVVQRDLFGFGFSLTFNPVTFGGSKKVYVNAFDTSGRLSHWALTGIYEVE